MKQLKIKWDLYQEPSPHGRSKKNIPRYGTATPTTAKTTQLSSYALSQAIDELRALSLSSSRAYVMLFVIFLKS